MAVHAPQTTLSQAERPFFAGVDVGGTNIKFGLVDNQGRTIEQGKIPTQEELGPANAVRRIADAIANLLDDARLDRIDLTAVGLATPGTMDIAAGTVLEPPNLPTWRHFPIRDRLREAVGKSVSFANDANAAAFGEYWVGAGKQLPSLVMLTLGTGVGGGIIVGDHSIDGEHSHGSECGHIIIDHGPHARMCNCGLSGHLEAYASANALIQRAAEVLRDDRPSTVRQRLTAGDELTPLLLAEEAEKGDMLSLELILELARFLGVGVATLVHTIDPGAVVLGGAMNFGGRNSELGRRFLEEVRAEFRRRTFPVLAEKTLVEFAELAGDAGYVGAAGIAGCLEARRIVSAARLRIAQSRASLVMGWFLHHSATRLKRFFMAIIDRQNIRNFCIVAHIDHGKSTLADRMLELTGTVKRREMKEQLLDDMELERARGITIKARAVAMQYTYKGKPYELNLIDTPGHVDFHYEVSRSLSCCEGAVLLADAFQGVEAQTVANAYAAMEQDLIIIPVLNKIDLAQSRPEEVIEELEHTLAIEAEDVLPCSAKTGVGVDELLAKIVERIPPPEGDRNGTLQAMVFDSNYDSFRGAIIYVRIMNGVVKKGQKVRLLRAGTVHDVVELGQFAPQRRPCDQLGAGQVGYLICNIKSLVDVHIGDTVSIAGENPAKPLAGYQEPKRMVYCGLYPSDGQDFEQLRDALTKLSINDPSFEFEPETSEALGFGFRCGFLGLLHMEIVQQRLEQEADVDLVQTAPNVTYEVLNNKGEVLEIHRPQEVPDAGQIDEFRQPIVRVNMVQPTEFFGAVMKLCTERRGIHVRTEYLSPTRAMLTFDLPLAEVIYDLHDKLKSATRGYGTMDYELKGYEQADLVRLDILVNGKRVDALAVICDRADGERRGRSVVKKLTQEIDRHMFEVAVQAAIGTRVIARETVPALRKNVTAKCYGGDITRKRKLWAKQKEGKKRMKSIGSVDIPQKAFMAVLDTGQEGKK